MANCSVGLTVKLVLHTVTTVRLDVVSVGFFLWFQKFIVTVLLCLHWIECCSSFVLSFTNGISFLSSGTLDC